MSIDYQAYILLLMFTELCTSEIRLSNLEDHDAVHAGYITMHAYTALIIPLIRLLSILLHTVSVGLRRRGQLLQSPTRLRESRVKTRASLSGPHTRKAATTATRASLAVF